MQIIAKSIIEYPRSKAKIKTTIFRFPKFSTFSKFSRISRHSRDSPESQNSPQVPISSRHKISLLTISLPKKSIRIFRIYNSFEILLLSLLGKVDLSIDKSGISLKRFTTNLCGIFVVGTLIACLFTKLLREGE